MQIENLSKDELLYEDDIGFVVLGKSVLGHIKVFPKKPVKKIEELSDEEVTHLFTIASSASTVVFETLGAQGTNIITHSNNQSENFHIDILPRNVNDDINLRWQPKQVPEPEMEDAQKRITDKCDDLKFRDEHKEKKKDNSEQSKESGEEKSHDKESKESQSEEDSYLVKHLERSP